MLYNEVLGCMPVKERIKFIEMEIYIMRGSKAQRASQFVLKNPTNNLGVLHKRWQTQSGEKIEQSAISNAIKRATGKSFTQIRRDAGKNFIEDHKGEPSEWLRQKLNVSRDTLATMVAELKKEGRLLKRYRTLESRARAEPLEYYESARGIVNLLRWLPIEKGMSVPDLVELLHLPIPTVRGTVKKLKDSGQIMVVEKKGQRAYYLLTPFGKEWSRKIDKKRDERDARLLKTKANRGSILRRKQVELVRLRTVVAWAERNRMILPGGLIQAKISEVRNEIRGLEKRV